MKNGTPCSEVDSDFFFFFPAINNAKRSDTFFDIKAWNL